MAEQSRFQYFERRKDDYIAYQTEEEVQRALIEVVVFAVFLIATTILALNCQNIDGFYANDSFRRLFIERKQEKFTWEIEKVTNMEIWWDYVKNDFLGRLNKILEYPVEVNERETDPLGLHNKPRFWNVNILLQPPSLRQIRVKPKECEKNLFLKENVTCYGKYSTADQSNEPYHKGTKYLSTEDTDIIPTWATIEFYSGGGYVVNIPSYNTETVLKTLQDEHWIDGGTRLVVLSVETLNYNLGVFNSIKLLTEVLPTGNVVCAFYSTIIPLDSIWSIHSPGLLLTACVFYAIVTYNLGNEIYEIRKFGIKKYATVFWNYIDLVIIICAYISLGISIAHPFNVSRFLRDIENGNEQASSDKMVLLNIIYIGTIALCTFHLWIRIFRFITFNATMLHFNMALRRCAPEIFGFALILVISFTIFGLLGLLAFGGAHPDFSTFDSSFFFMFRLMLHDFDYQNFNNVDPIWGPIYLMCYVLIVIFILVNMFLAIISQTYIDVKQDAQEQPIAIKLVLMNFIHKINAFFKPIFGRFRTPKPSLVTEPTQKRIQFAGAPELSDSQADSDTAMPKKMSENEALQSYFGIEPTGSVTSLMGSIKSDDSDDESEIVNETKRETTYEFLSGLEERLHLLEAGFEQLVSDIDHILAKLEGKARKTLAVPRMD